MPKINALAKFCTLFFISNPQKRYKFFRIGVNQNTGVLETAKNGACKSTSF